MSDDDRSQPDFAGSGAVEYRPDEATPRAPLTEGEEARLLALPGVTSVGRGADPSGADAIVIGVTDASSADRLPAEIGGVPVVIEVTGDVRALPEQHPIAGREEDPRGR